MVVRVRPNGSEVAPQRLQRVSLRVDLTGCAEGQPPQDWQGRALALHHLLKQESGYQCRQCQPALVHGRAEDRAREGQGRRVGLQGPLDIPLPVQLAEPAVDALRMSRVLPDALRNLAHDRAVDGCARVGLDPLNSARDHDLASCNDRATGRW
jgi:hypothetical protein